MGNRKTFNAIDELGNSLVAELLTIYFSDEYNIKYAVYSVKNEIGENIICASRMNKDNSLEDLKSNKERNYVINIVKNIIKEQNK